MTTIVFLTGSEPRHDFFRKLLALQPGIEVLRTYCESTTGSLAHQVSEKADAPLQRSHLEARLASEKEFFADGDALPDRSNPVFIERGKVDQPEIFAEIRLLQPQLILAYGCSILKGDLLAEFPRKILNLHLGLSPYYRGGGTNFWPFVNGEPEYVGATFMYLDVGIDTGEIIHQMRPAVAPGDDTFDIGNRLIRDAVPTYAKVANSLENLERMPQPPKTVGRVYRKRDLTENAIIDLKKQIETGCIEKYILEKQQRDLRVPIVQHPRLESQ